MRPHTCPMPQPFAARALVLDILRKASWGVTALALVTGFMALAGGWRLAAGGWAALPASAVSCQAWLDL